VPHIWNYFKTKHGKNDEDSTCIKTTSFREELKLKTNSLIGDAKSIVEWCSSIMVQGTRRQEKFTRKGHGMWSM
jgi:hypothetical protein